MWISIIKFWVIAIRIKSDRDVVSQLANNNNTLYKETDIYNLSGTYPQIVKTSRSG